MSTPWRAAVGSLSPTVWGCLARRATAALRRGLGGVEQAHRDGGDETERPLASHRGARQVVAGPVHGLAAEADELAATRDHLQPQDVVGGDAVLQAVRSPGVGRDVAADG